jgi:hypothetical protein
MTIGDWELGGAPSALPRSRNLPADLYLDLCWLVSRYLLLFVRGVVLLVLL